MISTSRQHQQQNIIHSLSYFHNTTLDGKKPLLVMEAIRLLLFKLTT